MRGRHALGSFALSVTLLLGFWLSIVLSPPRPSKETPAENSRGSSPALPALPLASEATTAQTRTVTFSYDQANRLAGQTISGGAQILYQYDASGNLIAMTSTHSLFLPSIERE